MGPRDAWKAAPGLSRRWHIPLAGSYSKSQGRDNYNGDVALATIRQLTSPLVSESWHFGEILGVWMTQPWRIREWKRKWGRRAWQNNWKKR